MSVVILTKLDRVKNYLGIDDTNSDSYLNQIISQMSQKVEEDTGRKFEKADYTEYFNGDYDKDSIAVSNYPINSIATIHDDTDRDYGSDSLVDSENYSFDAEAGIIYLETRLARGVKNIKVVYNGGYSEIPEDLELAVVKLVAAEYLISRIRINSQEGANLISGRVKDLKEEANQIIERYRRPSCG